MRRVERAPTRIGCDESAVGRRGALDTRREVHGRQRGGQRSVGRRHALRAGFSENDERAGRAEGPQCVAASTAAVTQAPSTRFDSEASRPDSTGAARVLRD
ncbi:hypothetical protein WS45_16280 [Burkholderia sp. RF2-non_BP3]|nr:hypothetical protein WS45_16280 [Burkholderia sp. RF2-non_BP3]